MLAATGVTRHDIHVSAVHNHNADRLPGVTVHKVIRRVSGELTPGGLSLDGLRGGGGPGRPLGEGRTDRQPWFSS